MTAIIEGSNWREWLPQLESLIQGEPSRVANLANVAAALYGMNRGRYWHWVGFYLVDKKRDELALGPFQGPVACTRLKRGIGVCAAAWERGETVWVPDVEKFPGHVACSQFSRSEIVVPVVATEVPDLTGQDQVVAVLDVDSSVLRGLSEEDVAGLEAVAASLGAAWNTWEE